MRIQASFSRVCRRCAPCPDFGKPFRHAARRETALHNTSCIVSDFMSLFSTIVTAKQPNSQTAKQPNSQTAKQPNSQTAKQPNSQTAKQPNSQTAKQPNSQTAKQPNSQTAKQPNSQTAKQPNSQTAKQPNSQTAKQPNSQTAKQPNSQTAKQPNSQTDGKTGSSNSVSRPPERHPRPLFFASGNFVFRAGPRIGGVPVRPAPIADFAGGLRPLNAPRSRDISSIRLHPVPPARGRREAQAGRGRAGIPPTDIAPLRNGESPEGDGTVMARAQERRMRETGALREAVAGDAIIPQCIENGRARGVIRESRGPNRSATGDCGGAGHDSSRRTVENPAHG